MNTKQVWYLVGWLLMFVILPYAFNANFFGGLVLTGGYIALGITLFTDNDENDES